MDAESVLYRKLTTIKPRQKWWMEWDRMSGFTWRNMLQLCSIHNTHIDKIQSIECAAQLSATCFMALCWGKSHRIRFVFICVCLVSSQRKRIETKRQYNVPTIEKARLLNCAVLCSSESNHIVAQFAIQMRSLQMIRAHPFYAFACRWFFSHLDQR